MRNEGKRRELLRRLQPLVRRIAERETQRFPQTIEPDQLIRAGYRGLLDAVQRFDPERGIRLNTWCARRVRGAILDELRRLHPS